MNLKEYVALLDYDIKINILKFYEFLELEGYLCEGFREIINDMLQKLKNDDPGSIIMWANALAFEVCRDFTYKFLEEKINAIIG